MSETPKRLDLPDSSALLGSTAGEDLERQSPRRIVEGCFGDTSALPADAKGRPLDPDAASWWDGGFRVVGYIPPPPPNFKRFVKAVRQSEDPRRQRRLARRARRHDVA